MREALAALPGVRNVRIDFGKKQAIVAVESIFTDPQQLVEALTQVNFGGSVVGDTGGDDSSPKPDEKPKPGLLNEDAPPDKDEGSAQSAHSSAFNKHVAVTPHLGRNLLRPGDAFRIAVVVEIGEGWHIYGNPVGPGIGRATVVSAQAPEGFQFEPARYPPAHKAEQDFGDSNKTWVWEHTGKTIHYLSGTVGADVQPGDYEWKVEVSGQVCTDTACLPGKAVVPLMIQIAEKNTPTEVANADLFVGFQEAKPASDESQK